MGSQATGEPTVPASAGLAKWLLFAAALVLADQASKLGFDASLRYGERLHVLPFFDFTLLAAAGTPSGCLASQATPSLTTASTACLTTISTPAVPVDRQPAPPPPQLLRPPFDPV